MTIPDVVVYLPTGSLSELPCNPVQHSTRTDSVYACVLISVICLSLSCVSSYHYNNATIITILLLYRHSYCCNLLLSDFSTGFSSAETINCYLDELTNFSWLSKLLTLNQRKHLSDISSGDIVEFAKRFRVVVSS